MESLPPQTAEELLRRYANGERVFSDVELDMRDADGNYPDFSGAHLAGIVFHRSFLIASFRGAHLQSALFQGNVKTCNFDDADLRGADFSGCAVDAATFHGANLEEANFAGAFYQGYEIDDNDAWVQGLRVDADAAD